VRQLQHDPVHPSSFPLKASMDVAQKQHRTHVCWEETEHGSQQHLPMLLVPTGAVGVERDGSRAAALPAVSTVSTKAARTVRLI